jgi:predicted permease
VASALLGASFIRITTADLGFDRDNVVAVPILASVKALPPADRQAAITTLINDALARVRQVPGVVAAGLEQNGLPLSGTSVRYSIAIPGRGDTYPDMLETRMITAGYVETMGLRLLEGRVFNQSDRAGAPRVALINDVAARQFFGGPHVLGRTFDLHGSTTIIGVLQGVRLNGPEQELRPEVYLSAEQWDGHDSDVFGDIVARVRREPAAMIPAIDAAIGPNLHPARFPARVIDDAFRKLTAARRFNAAVMAIYGAIAVLIGAIGIYGTMAFFVVQRVREIGVRMALGASPERVMRTVLRDASGCVLLGLAIGLAGARAVSSLFSALVFGVTPTSPSVYAGVAVLLMAVGLLAAFIPARRAARLDPLVALRQE